MSTLAIEALIAFKESANLNLCQEFIWNNPAKLPTPAQWVNVERIRVKDSFTRLWWLSPTKKPKADNRNVLQSYSKSMRQLLGSQKYNSGVRPSEHRIGEKSFLNDNGGAIPGSVITCGNTSSQDSYHEHCRNNEIYPHPARMPEALVDFFVSFLTSENDVILDPFAGSNTTGASAEKNLRKWLAIEQDPLFIKGSFGRFPNAKWAKEQEWDVEIK